MNPRTWLVAGTVLTATLGLAACSGDSDSESDAVPSVSTTTAPANLSVEQANLVGPGCPAYVAQVPSGKGSVEGMANDPVVTAAGNNPMLKTLTEAVSGKLNPEVDLSTTLDGKDYTVFAPVDTAFAQVPAKRMAKLKKDRDALVKTLTYHVVSGELAPAKVIGEQLTVEGGTLRVTGKGNQIKVDGANVICGGIKTANATVYLIDKVLEPSG
ncbi:fasciclin domain-containing protein [Kineosporia sp. J2-2]|uniref:Fasciclin domain-containing protein n=1 Tax=Kineosporia corallincola TaxID=2835133 RepID=A0ABS5TMY1_9ACTN|nr:fasciclin domain-containing protein [Kineosporia corallincola]MBT0772458.1 fasciclin domain-containing protein [Kineosporia corallincola]